MPSAASSLQPFDNPGLSLQLSSWPWCRTRGCSLQMPKDVGTSCDDGDDSTQHDTCGAGGSCHGLRKQARRACPAGDRFNFRPLSQLSSRSCHCAHFTELRCPSAFEIGAVVGQDSRAVDLDLAVYRGGAAVTAPTVILQSHVGNVYPVGTTVVNAVGTVCLDDGPDGCVEVGCSFDVTVLDACGYR